MYYSWKYEKDENKNYFLKYSNYQPKAISEKASEIDVRMELYQCPFLENKI